MTETRAERIERIRRECAEEAKSNIDRLAEARTTMGHPERNNFNGKWGKS